jgi:Uma2 family endonuclease
MTEAAAQHMSMRVTEYLAYADAHPRQRFELLAGVPVAMAPATLRHNLIAGNIDAALRGQVRDRGCQSFREAGVASSDDAEFMAQPDVLVRCGPLDGRRRWVDDPVVIVEVLSPSTMLDDRGYKLKTYLDGFPSLRHVALVYQDECRIEHWSRGVDGAWTESPRVLNRMQDAIEFSAVGAALPLSAIYDDVIFD